MKMNRLYSILLLSFLMSGCSLLTYIENKIADYNIELEARQREEVVVNLIQDNNALLPRPQLTHWFSLSMRQQLKLIRECSLRLNHKSGQKELKSALEKLAKVIERDVKKIDQSEQARGYRFTAARLIAISTDKKELLKAIETHKINYRIQLEAYFPQVDKQHIETYVDAHANLLKYLCSADA